ncbi:acyltransferase [Azoarcus sp. L1K30]|uniref:acyltransferase family protein n=1 Tax=Azoarcus sp. L1K30 TaxID=2820277 RepID=UPI001B832426|nr:acyltransferase [Azoarcus sp. L1K30]MBR0566029.1 acyltransferase [Azoarcus sp. L1K30]
MLGYYRLTAAIGVLIAHANLGSDSMSRAMVGAFFILSGYLMAMTLSGNYSGNPLPFYWNRFLRIYPMHTIVALAIFVLTPSFAREVLGSGPTEDYVTALFGSLTLMFGYQPLIGPAWTLPYELSFYLIAPIFLPLRWRSMPIGLLILVTASTAWLYVHAALPFMLRPFAIGYTHPVTIPTSMLMFAFGAILHELRNHIGHTRADGALEWTGILLLLGLIILGSRYINPDMKELDANFGNTFQIVTYLSAALMLLGWRRSESPTSKLAGDLTNPTYLVHWPLLHAGIFNLTILRQTTDWFGKLFPLGHLVAISTIVLSLTLLLSYVLLRFDARFIQICRSRERNSIRRRIALS